MKVIIAFFLFWFSVLCHAQQDEILTNQSVIEMMSIGLSDEIIQAKISTSKCRFDTSIQALKELKDKGVSNNVIIAIMHSSRKPKPVEEESTTSGIFYLSADSSLVQIYPTAFSGTQTNTIGSALTYGIASTKIRTVIPGASSKNVISTQLPEFYFQFRTSACDLSLSDWWFSSATSPNQFALVRLKTKRNRRELKTGSVNVYAGYSFGIDPDMAVDFTFEETGKSRFKVTPSKLLPPGEYCFVYQGVIPTGGFLNQSVFDFSVSESSSYPSQYTIGSKVYAIVDNDIRKFTIVDVYTDKSGYIYIGEDNYCNFAQFSEAHCSPDKEKLKTILEQMKAKQ